MDANLKASLLCAWALLWMSLLLGAAANRPFRRSGLRAWQQARADYRRFRAWNRHLTAKLLHHLFYLLKLFSKRHVLPALPTRLFVNGLWNSMSYLWYFGIPALWGAWHLHISTFCFWLIGRGLLSEILFQRRRRQQRLAVGSHLPALAGIGVRGPDIGDRASGVEDRA